MTSEATIFTWRASEIATCIPPIDSEYYLKTRSFWEEEATHRPDSFCPYCTGNLSITELAPPIWYDGRTGRDIACKSYRCEKHSCTQCGFWVAMEDIDQRGDVYITQIQRALLCGFDINDAALGFDEIGTHLKNNYSDIYNIAPRKFERLIYDIYKNLGYNVKLTQQSNDRGFDLVLIEKNSDSQILVECKRYAHNRKIGVDLIRQLVGAMADQETENSIFVTTSSYTKGARNYVEGQKAKKYGFSIQLEEADQLLRNVGAYNHPMPLMSIHSKLTSENDDWTQHVRSMYDKPIPWKDL